MKIEDLGKVISTDVLVIGGGFGGLIAAITAREHPVDVLIVEKQTVGWSGKGTKIGAMISAVAPEDDADKFVEWHVKNIGDYLNDQELLYAWTREGYKAIKQLSEWGVNVLRDEKGNIDRFEHFWVRHCSCFGIDLDLLLPLRGKACRSGVKIINKIQIVELLKRNDRVVGAVGFNIIDGQFFVFKAKSVILANGSCDYKVQRMWTSACGEGIASAFRAGAEMRNAEYGNFYDTQWADTGAANPGGRQYVVNAQGENVTMKYMPDPDPVDITVAMALGMEKEILEGRGPLYVDMNLVKQANAFLAHLPIAKMFHQTKLKELEERTNLKEIKYGPPQSPEKREVHLGLLAELSPIKVDHQMKTSLAGLWAIGDTCHGGSALAGAVPGPPGRLRGNGLGFAAFSAMRGGPDAADFAMGEKSYDMSGAEIKRLKENAFAPLNRVRGIDPEEIIVGIQKIVCPTKYNLRRSRERLEEGLSMIREIKEKLPELRANDGHGLAKCNEAKSMTICAEFSFMAALMREESRGWHFREDYPDRDDENWLKWITVKDKAGRIILSTEDVPIDKFKIKPLRKR